MQATRWIGLAGLALLFGCVPSLHPLYTEEDLVFDPALIGAWSGENADETWTFEKHSPHSYSLAYSDEEGDVGEFEVHLAKVEGRLFIDLYPEKPNLGDNEYYEMHILPAHTFMWVRQIEPTLEMAVLNPDWLDGYLEEYPYAVQHEEVDGRTILTASPKELQKFLMTHAAGEDAWGDFSRMERRTRTGTH